MDMNNVMSWLNKLCLVMMKQQHGHEELQEREPTPNLQMYNTLKYVTESLHLLPYLK